MSYDGPRVPLTDGLRLDHIGIAVPDLEKALGFWRDQLGATVRGTETVESQGVRVAFLATGDATTELLEPTRDDSPIAKFLSGGRGGIHHITYEVEDIAEKLRELEAGGVPLIHKTPVPGSRGTQIAFLHPKGTGGVLVELVQYAKDE